MILCLFLLTVNKNVHSVYCFWRTICLPLTAFTQEQIISSVRYQSLMVLQQAQKEESKIMIFDTSRPTRFYGFSPLSLLSYMKGEQRWAIALGLEVQPFGHLSFKDTEWDRDMVAVLVKQKNEMSAGIVDSVIDILLDVLEDPFIETLLHTMVKRTSSVDEKQKDEDDIKSLAALEEGPGQEPYDDDTRRAILKLWFGNAVVGPFAITRSISIQRVKNLDCLLGPAAGAVRNRMAQRIFHEEVDHITILDDDYYMISGGDAQDMKWPDDVTCDFLAVADKGQQVEVKQTQRIKSFGKQYVEGRPKSTKTMFSIRVEDDGTGKYLRLKYGSGVFGEVNNVIARIVNTISFTKWLKSREIGLELWYGRDEKDKIDDHRKLIKLYQELQEENKELRKLLNKGKRGRK